MAQPTISVKDGGGGSVTVFTINPNGSATGANSQPVVIASDQTAVPISAASLPLPSGAATAAKQPALGTAGTASTDVLSVQGIASGTALAVSAASLPLPTGAATAAKQPALGTAGSASTDVITVQGIASGTAQPISATSLPLPTGASTAAKQPALGTAGTASTDVLTVQGIASMTALKVDGSAVTQPVSTPTSTVGTVSAFTSTSPATLLALNTSRKGATVWNEGNNGGTLTLLMSATTLDNNTYTLKIPPGFYWEMPLLYTGLIQGRFDVSDTARVVEYT